MSDTAALVMDRSQYKSAVIDIGRDMYSQRKIMTNPIAIEGDSIILDPKVMKVGQYYSAELDGKPYLYRKTGENEIEMYGLAEQD